jgi:hypothetical protein
VTVVANAGIREWCVKYAPTNGSVALGFLCSVERGVLDDSVFYEF